MKKERRLQNHPASFFSYLAKRATPP